MAAVADLDRLVAAVERLSVEVPDLKNSIDRMGTTLTAARERTEQVAQTASSGTRSLRRRWILPLVVAILVVGTLGGVVARQSHDTTVRFNRTSQGLVDSCTARQRSDAALRVKNEQLRDDTVALARAFAASPEASRIGPILNYLNAEAKAYDAYLKAIPPPFDCQARYGR